MPTTKRVEEEVKEEDVVEEEEKEVTYYIKDKNDRFFTEDEHGFDLTLEAGKRTEVTKEVVELVEEKYPYLTVIKE